MSVIAWDGTTLAADKRASIGTLIRTTTKIFRVRGDLVGFTGDADTGMAMLAWFEAGADPARWPETQRDKDTWSGLLVIKPDGEIWKFERTPFAVKHPPQHFAVGCGRDFALAAMYLGKSAAEAVEVAIHFDSGCGNGVDVLEHHTGAGRADQT